jgi:hypothetical protein
VPSGGSIWRATRTFTPKPTPAPAAVPPVGQAPCRNAKSSLAWERIYPAAAMATLLLGSLSLYWVLRGRFE